MQGVQAQWFESCGWGVIRVSWCKIPGLMQSNEPKRNHGERGRIRTCDPCLKRALLYQLSYAPAREMPALRGRDAKQGSELSAVSWSAPRYQQFIIGGGTAPRKGQAEEARQPLNALPRLHRAEGVATGVVTAFLNDELLTGFLHRPALRAPFPVMF